MPRYMIERTFPDGLAIPSTPDGADACLNVVGLIGGHGVTWVHSYVSDDKRTRSACTTARARRRSAPRPATPTSRSTASRG
jgi:hypothetical protein